MTSAEEFRARVLRTLATGREYTCSELCKAVGAVGPLDEAVVSVAAFRLVREGKIAKRRDGRDGLWRFKEAGP
jgi:DNA-binding transcriptional ArsR family regulator